MDLSSWRSQCLPRSYLLNRLPVYAGRRLRAGRPKAPRPMRAATYSIPTRGRRRGHRRVRGELLRARTGRRRRRQYRALERTGARSRRQACSRPKIDKRTVRGVPITMIDASGTYTGMGGPMIGRCEAGGGLSPDRRDRRRSGRQRVLQADGPGEDDCGAAEEFRAAARVDPAREVADVGADLIVVAALRVRRSSSCSAALLALRWPRVIWLHVPAVIWGALIEFTGWICPLTPLENRLRRASGEAGYQGDFIAHYILPVLYPNGLTRTDQLVLGGAGARPQRRHLHVRRRPPSPIGPANDI